MRGDNLLAAKIKHQTTPMPSYAYSPYLYWGTNKHINLLERSIRHNKPASLVSLTLNAEKKKIEIETMLLRGIDSLKGIDNLNPEL